MKLKFVNSQWFQASLGAALAIAFLAAAAETLSYAAVQKQADLAETNVQLGEKLLDATQLNGLMRDLNGARIDNAKSALRAKLSKNLRVINTLIEDVDSGERNMAYAVESRIKKNQPMADNSLAEVPEHCSDWN